MTALDTAAVKALVESAGALSGHTFVTKVPAGPQTFPYAVIHPAEGNDVASRFTGPAATTNPEFTLHLVAETYTSVQTQVALVKAKFVSNGFFTPPAVTGRRNLVGYWRSPLPIQIDKDVTPWLIYAVVELGWESEPA